MSNKKLAILGIIAAVMLILAVLMSQLSNKAKTISARSSYLVSGVNIDEIDSIVIKSGDDTLTFKRTSGGFVLVDKDNYPADTEKVNDLITDCLETKISQIVTDNPANHADLGVTEEKAKTVVKFLKPDSSVLVGIIIGNTKEKGQATYVRLTSDNKVYEASQTPYINSVAINYLKAQLIALARKDIQLVTVDSSKGKYILKPKTDSENVELVNIPAGKKLKQSEAKNVFTVLSSLNFTDVMKNPGNLNFDRHYICRLFNSTEFTFDIASRDDKTYVTCRAVFTEEIKEPKAGDKPTADQLKEIQEKQTLDRKADDFTRRNMGWVYEIPGYKAKYLTCELSDLVEDDKDAEVTNTPDPNMILNEIQPDEQTPGF